MENELTYEQRKELMRVKRENACKVYSGNPILSERIPNIVADLFKDQFNIDLPCPQYTVPITVETAWRKILAYVQSQPVDEFTMDIAGVSLEYVTTISESDKSTNIEPQMFHTKDCIFQKVEHNATLGSDVVKQQLQDYAVWRSVNLTEHLAALEEQTFSEILTEFGIHLGVNAAVLPICAAAYTAAVAIAREAHITIDFYHLFEIDVVGDNQIVLNPLNPVKQKIKNDSKK